MRRNFYAMNKENHQTKSTLSLSKVHSKTRVFMGKSRPKLDYQRYLSGRSYQLFRAGIKNQVTLGHYNKSLYHFCKFLDASTEDIVSTYGSASDNRIGIASKGPMDLQHRMEDYVMALQQRVDKEEIKATTCMSVVAPIRLFADMNDIVLNWKKIWRLVPRSDMVASDKAYSRGQIKRMLDYCDLRARVIILFLASSGMRLRGLAGLKDGDVNPIHSEGGSEVIAAHVVVYRGTDSQYDTFVTPEAWKSYEAYRNMRKSLGEAVSEDSPLLVARSSAERARKGKIKEMYYGSIRDVVSVVCFKAGLIEASKEYKERFVIKRIHGFRKFFNSTLRSIKTKDGQPAIQFTSKERLLGHALINQYALERNYDRTDIKSELLQDYLKAAPELTISEEFRLAAKVEELRGETNELRAKEVTITQKDLEIRRLEERVCRMEEASQKRFAEIMLLLRQNPMLAHVKPDVLFHLNTVGSAENNDDNMNPHQGSQKTIRISERRKD